MGLSRAASGAAVTVQKSPLFGWLWDEATAEFALT
jgi:hypothetical protein